MPIESPIFHSSLSSIFDAWRALIHAATHHHIHRPMGAQIEEEDPYSNNTANELLALTLSDLGAPTDENTIELAEYLTRAGQPITLSGITSARSDIASAPEASPASVALAIALDIPRSAYILNAISSVIEGLPPPDDLQTDAKKELTAEIGSDDTAEDAAVEISNMIGRLALSAERKIATREAVIDDPRIALLTLSMDHENEDEEDKAEKLARHIEGQQLLNSTKSNLDDENDDLYFAFYMSLEEESSFLVEIKVARKRERERETPTDSLILDEDEQKASSPKMNALKSTIRLHLKKLGALEAEIDVGETTGMSCELRAEKQSTVRMLRKHAPELADAFVAAGWSVNMVQVSRAESLPPLWRKGEDISRPRQRFNAKV